VAEGLSRSIAEAKTEGSIKRIRVADSVFITQLLFVDDILLFGQGSLRELKKYKELLDTYCGAIGMEVNMGKSCMLFKGLGMTWKDIYSKHFHCLPLQ
jgi:hypothetical protein